MRTNSEFLKKLKAPASSFYLCDFHVHSPGSADTRVGDRFQALSDNEKKLLSQLSTIPKDLAEYEKGILRTCAVSKFYDLLIERRAHLANTCGIPEGMDWAVLAVTDHNVAEYSAELSQYAWEHRTENRLIILPGIELDVIFPASSDILPECGIHLLCVFPPLTSSSDIRIAITQGSESPAWNFGQPLRVGSLPLFIGKMRHSANFPCICIAAHVSSSKGIQNEVKRTLLGSLDAAIVRTEAEIELGHEPDEKVLRSRLDELKGRREASEKLHEEVLRQIGRCGFDALQVRDKRDEKHYRRLHRFKHEQGRAVPISCSDAHSVEHVFANDSSYQFLKLTQLSGSVKPMEIFDEIRHKALRYGDTRFSFASPTSVREWIAGVEIIPDAVDAQRFWPFAEDANHESFILALSRNLNCVIGGRGSGKSAILEAIAFILKPDEFASEGKKSEKDRASWYKRATATLGGCVVRISWKSTPEGCFSGHSKNTVIQKRYFDPKHNHGAVENTDVEDKEVLSHSVAVPPVTLLRIHEIEEAASPDKLRELFDRLEGGTILKLSKEISAIRSRLSAQRVDLVRIAETLEHLTKDKQPLAEYVRRKLQFLEVNKAEVQKQYANVDNAAHAENISTTITTACETLAHEILPSESGERISEFFRGARETIRAQDSSVKPNCEGINLALGMAGDENGREAKLARLVGVVAEEIGALSGAISDAQNKIIAEHRAAREELVRKGLPVGGKDREAKKKAFEEAESSLETYRTSLERWNAMMKERKEIHDELVRKCIERTELRRKHAATLTKQLAQDLDSSVLAVEVDARPIEDKHEFIEWLQTKFAPSTVVRYKEARIKAIIEKPVLPAQLRDILLSEEACDERILLINAPRAQDGQIKEDDLSLYLNDTRGIKRLAPELKEEEVAPEVWGDLPEEVRRGFLGFVVNATERQGSRIDAVLALDEVLFDDLPQVKLNDRPGDIGSKARDISELSPGQRCSAVLPILLLSGTTPLLIDQPEDNLDNRLIRQVIVNILASIKLRRQVIVATHNPNLPVLGDAEQVVILRAVRERGCALDVTGNLDSAEVVQYITDIMEGGREAFQYRHSIYQSHWQEPIARACT
jgi:energy-coupling factor transporter ATP-binding protein EcfA2